MCDKEVESVGHVGRVCTGLAQREYQRRHYGMVFRVYCVLCWKYGVKCGVKRWWVS